MNTQIEWHEENRELTNRILHHYASQCRYILEVGTGVSTEVFAKAVQGRKGHVWSIDRKGEVLNKTDWMTFIVGNSLEVPWKRCVDLLYLDGCHKPHHVRKELDKYARWVNPGGYILFDDARCHDVPRLEGVVDQWCRDVWLSWYYPLPEPCGTAVVEVTRRLGDVPLSPVTSSTDCSFCDEEKG